MIRRALLIFGLAVAATVAPHLRSEVPTASAEQFVIVLDGYRCEINEEATLAKAICRHPSNPGGDYYLVYLDRSSGHTIYRDRFYSNGVFYSDTIPLSDWPR